MGRGSIRIIVLTLIAVLVTIGAQAQVSFRAETPIVPLGSPGCVQIGLFLNDSGMGMNKSWEMLVATLDYSADPGVLAGAPEARLSGFGLMTEPGLTNPATPQPPHMMHMSACYSANTTNRVILTGGMPIAFMSGSGMAMLSETVNPMTMTSGRISLLSGGSFNTQPMQDQLFAILTFPVTGQPGSIQVNFSMAMPGSNALIDENMMTLAATTTGGGILFDGISTAIPTLSEWGIIAFLSGLLLSALFLLRRRSIPS